MNSSHLLSAFKNALAWNALLFAFYKLANTGLSFLLYNTLSSSDFYFWAMSNAVIYLSLLWLDCGFRKSIARYVPIFLSDTDYYQSMIKKILLFQLSMLSGAVALSIGLRHYMLVSPEYNQALYLCFGIFLSQGILFIVQLLFHAQFFNKQFNTISMATTALEIVPIAVWFAIRPNSLPLLHTVLWSKFITTLIAILIATITFKKVSTKQVHHNKYVDNQTKQAPFVVHTFIMWVTTVLKSLTERNFLVPFFSMALGMPIASLFKLANDAALLFYRVIVKSLGSADTALLSHVQTGYHADINFNKAFANISKQIIILSIPIMVVVPAMSHAHKLMASTPWLWPFLIITSCYLIESLLIPFERVLEVKQNYRYLIYSYIPYLVGIIGVAMSMVLLNITFIQALVAIHAIRIASMGCMAVLALRAYKIAFPIRYTIKMITLFAGSAFVISKMIAYMIG